jgi:hypothetical protein
MAVDIDVVIENSVQTLEKRHFGATASDLVGTVDADGAYIVADKPFVLDMRGVKTLQNYGLLGKFARTGVVEARLDDLGDLELQRQLFYTFYGATKLKKVVLGTVDVLGDYACYGTFANCHELEEVDSHLDFLSGEYCCYGMFANCAALKESPLKTVTLISGSYAAQYMCQNTTFEDAGVDNIEYIGGTGVCRSMFANSGVKRANFASLVKLEYGSSCALMFDGCSQLEVVYYPSLVEIVRTAFGSSANSMKFRGCTALREIHFRADAREAVEDMSGYSLKWGAEQAQIIFDL